MLSQESHIIHLDLAYLENRLVDRQKWSVQTAKEAVRRYKNFLILLLRYPSDVLAPASDIDEVWHTHILFTREYSSDCDKIFGGYLHHTPSQGSDPDAQAAMQEAQTHTSSLYFKEFGESYFPELNIASFW